MKGSRRGQSSSSAGNHFVSAKVEEWYNRGIKKKKLPIPERGILQERLPKFLVDGIYNRK